MAGNYTFTITGATGNDVEIGGHFYGDGTGQTFQHSLSDIAAGGTSAFLIDISSNPDHANVNFDDVNFSATVTPVPEPINYALASFGLIFLGGGAGRFYLARRRSSTAS